MRDTQVAAIVGQPGHKEWNADGSELWLWERKTLTNKDTAMLLFQNGRVVAVGKDRPRQVVRTAAAPPEVSEPVVATSVTAPVTNSPPVVTDTAPIPDVDPEKDAVKVEPALTPKLAPPDLEAHKTDGADPAPKPPIDFPPLTAWYKARQIVTEALEHRRALFPNPRFAPGVTGEERISGNLWRAWGFVDTVNDENAPVRRHWIVEVEFLGTSWHRKTLSWTEK